MAFQKRRVQAEAPKKNFKKRSYKKVSYEKKSKARRKWIFSRFFWYTILGLFVFGLICIFILYQKVIAPLPSISELENIDIAEASTIYDREWGEMYKIFEEKRTYVNFSNINRNIINALVAWEDKRYWENPWVDFIGLIRAWIYWVIWKSDGFEGTSTLTQQLIRNTIIENRSSSESIFEKVERKIKEIYLAFKLTNWVSKEKIIELYLNKISYWSNAFGIEQASQTFFGKKATEINILEASMLASLPKWPSYYSPYNNFDRLVWYPYVYSGDDTENAVNIISPASVSENQESITLLKDFISDWKVQRYSDSKALICGLSEDDLKSNISVDGDGCSVIDYAEFLTLLNSIKIESGDKFVEYQTGRKDFILGRMLEDDYITFDEYKDALITSIGYTFQPYTEDIKHPHFVFYVREYLEEKYGKYILETGWLKIYTSLDPVLQNKAEEIVSAQSEINQTKFGANNAALVSIDNETGEILAMVGGRDYFDEEHQWNVNMVTSALQPGSSFKAFVYGLAIDQEIIGTKTPIYDVPTTFPGNYTPKNYDGNFMGKMTVSAALNYSRNIPAVKMYYLAGGEENILQWMEKLWVNSIREYRDNVSETTGTTYTYWASMSLGTVMITPLELAQSLSVFANLWKKKELVPVIQILDSQWLVIEEFQKEQNLGEQVIDAASAYILNSILSDTTSRPSFWNTYLSLSGRKVAAKTGTSTKQSSAGGAVVYPRNLWTIGYTPQVTTVAWAWNNDWSETKLNWNGLEAAGPIWKQFMDFYHSDEPVLDWKIPSWVKQVDISEISWNLAPDDFPANLKISSLFVNAPTNYDSSLKPIQVDLLCNGPVNERTPISAIGNVNVLSLQSLRPNDPAWEQPVQAWLRSSDFLSQFGLGNDYITAINPEACERTWIAWNIEVGADIQNGDTLVAGSNYMQIWYQSDSPLKQIDVYLDDEKIKQINLSGDTQWVYAWDIPIPKGTSGRKNLVFRAIDSQYYSQGTSYSVDVISSDTVAPEITVTNPSDNSISLYEGDFFNLRGTVTDISSIRSINIYINGNAHKIGLTWREFTQVISTDNLEPGQNTIRIEAVDFEFNIWETQVTVNVI